MRKCIMALIHSSIVVMETLIGSFGLSFFCQSVDYFNKMYHTVYESDWLLKVTCPVSAYLIYD